MKNEQLINWFANATKVFLREARTKEQIPEDRLLAEQRRSLPLIEVNDLPWDHFYCCLYEFKPFVDVPRETLNA